MNTLGSTTPFDPASNNEVTIKNGQSAPAGEASVTAGNIWDASAQLTFWVRSEEKHYRSRMAVGDSFTIGTVIYEVVDLVEPEQDEDVPPGASSGHVTLRFSAPTDS